MKPSWKFCKRNLLAAVVSCFLLISSCWVHLLPQARLNASTCCSVWVLQLEWGIQRSDQNQTIILIILVTVILIITSQISRLTPDPQPHLLVLSLLPLFPLHWASRGLCCPLQVTQASRPPPTPAAATPASLLVTPTSFLVITAHFLFAHSLACLASRGLTGEHDEFKVSNLHVASRWDP